MNSNDLKNKSWYWVLIDGYSDPTPCLYMSSGDLKYFLPAGLGDSSSMGLFENDIEKVGPEIIVPIF